MRREQRAESRGCCSGAGGWGLGTVVQGLCVFLQGSGTGDWGSGVVVSLVFSVFSYTVLRSLSPTAHIKAFALFDTQ